MLSDISLRRDTMALYQQIVGTWNPDYILDNLMESGQWRSGTTPKGLTVTSLLSAYKRGELFRPPFELTGEKFDISDTTGGVFIYVPPNTKLQQPITACFLIDMSNQFVINQIVVDKNSEVNLIVGCATTAYRPQTRQHLSVTEIYLADGAKLRYSMVHSWDETVEVLPYTSVVAGNDVEITFNYVGLHPVKRLISSPRFDLRVNSSVTVNSVVFLKRGYVELGGEAYLRGEGAKAFLNSRVVTEEGHIISRGYIYAEAKDTVGHIECDGLLLSDRGRVITQPTLSASVMDVSLTHEASLGKLSETEIEWLLAKGFSEDEAKALILSGFLNLSDMNLPDNVQLQVRQILGSREFNM